MLKHVPLNVTLSCIILFTFTRLFQISLSQPMDLETSFDIDWNKIIIDRDLNSLFLAGTLPRKQILR